MSKRDYDEWLTRLPKRERKEAEAWVDSLDDDGRADYFEGFGYSRLDHIIDSPSQADQTSLSAWLGDRGGDVPDSLVHDPWDNIEALMDGDDDRSRLGAALQTLTPRQREVFNLYYCEGKKQAECGVALGITQQVVCEHLQLLKIRLNDNL